MNLQRTLLSLVIASLAIVPIAAQSKPQYEIYAVRYATLPGFSVSELVAGADRRRQPTAVDFLLCGGPDDWGGTTPLVAAEQATSRCGAGDRRGERERREVILRASA